MFHNLDQLRLQLESENLHKVNAKTCLEVLRTQFKEFLPQKGGIESINNILENALSISVNETQMQTQEEKVNMCDALDAGLVVTESSGTKSDKQDTSSRSGTYITHDVDADIRPVNDQVPFAEVQLTAQHNVLATEQHHT
ncbi:hypothetical protein Tco_0222087 [Tanacetum coccineum]